MTGALHTPGPWSYDPENGEIRAHSGVVADTCTSDFTADQDEHNGRLMAAAPELIEALKRLTTEAVADGMQTRPGWDAWVSLSREAIAKAEGRA